MQTYSHPGVYIEEASPLPQPIAGAGTSTAAFIGIVPDTVKIPVRNLEFDPSKPADATNIPSTDSDFTMAAAGTVHLCLSFSDFYTVFGGFSSDAGQSILAQAVFGFFSNGGTRCYVVREVDTSALAVSTLKSLAAIDEIALVAAPGVVDAAAVAAIVAHCAVDTGDRFAILDSPLTVEDVHHKLDLSQLNPSNASNVLPAASDYAAFYFPWLQVLDPAAEIQNPSGDGRAYGPSSGHVAGVYARVDATQGVQKAPANQPVVGALGLKYVLGDAEQAALNPQGVNCIRSLNGAILLWGARTLGGDANGEWKYINVRRLVLYLRKSIVQGTQWVISEPNDQSLWAQITRSISAFLTQVWRNGALVGSTPDQAFFVRCDSELNPAASVALGQVVMEVGVAVLKPAEFVILRISKTISPGA